MKEKPPKMTPVSISAGTLTVDGWTGKARLNYDIADLEVRWLCVYAPGIGTTIVSQSPFCRCDGEQPGAFNNAAHHHRRTDTRLNCRRTNSCWAESPQSAWVAVDRRIPVAARKFQAFG